ncbi:MAG: reprolysin-like metallopeptidase [Aeromonas sobria]
MMKFTINAISVVIAMSANIALASPWHMVEKRSRQADDVVRATSYTAFEVDPDFLDKIHDGLSTITLPLPNGHTVDFEISAYSVLPPKLAAQYPEIKTFKGHEVNNANNTGRFDISPRGFNGMFMHEGEQVYVDIQRNGYYAVYYKKDARSSQGQHINEVVEGSSLKKRHASSGEAQRNETNYSAALKVYRIAISTTGEYTQYFGDTARALASLTTLVNRLNDVYERDIGARFELAEGNQHIIFTDPASDQFFNGSNNAYVEGVSAWVDKNDARRNTLVQKFYQNTGDLGDFDIGHVLTTEHNAGIAAVGSLCTSDGIAKLKYRSNGMTGNTEPVGDAFFVDFVAHEIGHQFGAQHTFNAINTGSCGSGLRATENAWEPGSGSSIMGYAGLCQEQDLQSNSEAYFHSKSIEQMIAHIATTVPESCGRAENHANLAPVVTVGVPRVIPVRTAFRLVGSGNDADGDRLTYSWEQVDLGKATTNAWELLSGNNSNGPLYRFVAPSASPVRDFPSLATQLKGFEAVAQQPIDQAIKGDVWAGSERTLNFRLVARDGKGGGAYGETSVEVVDTGSQTFKILPAPDQRILVGSPTTVNWQVAGTDGGRINCQRVDISYSNDEGKSWQTLVDDNGVSNNGAHEVTIPANAGSTVRLKLACSDNIFYAITPKLTTKSGDTPAPQPESPAPQPESNGGGGGGSTGLFALLGLGIAALLRRRETMSH